MGTPNDVATIQQLVPFDNKWEFQYLFRNYPEGELQVMRVPMLGLALIDFPKLDGGSERMIVHFGQESMGDLDSFSLYTPYAWDHSRFLHPFFQNGPQSRALGIAPSGSPDDYFEEVKSATAELQAEEAFASKVRALHKTWEGVRGDCVGLDQFIRGLDNFFMIQSGSSRNSATMAEWEEVFTALEKTRLKEGDRGVVKDLMEVAKLPLREVDDMQDAVREEKGTDNGN